MMIKHMDTKTKLFLEYSLSNKQYQKSDENTPDKSEGRYYINMTQCVRHSCAEHAHEWKTSEAMLIHFRQIDKHNAQSTIEWKTIFDFL